MKTALLAGATGLVGGHCLAGLLESREYDRVVVLARRAEPLSHDKLEWRVVDFDRLAAQAEGLKVDDVFCCLGTTRAKAGSGEAFRRVDFEYPVALAELAVGGGARQFLVISAVGADARSRIFYNRVKGEMEEAVARLPLPGVQIFRPALLLGKRREFRAAEQAGAVLLPWLAAGPLRRYRPIEARTVAAAMLKAAGRARRGVDIFESEQIRSFSSA